MPAKSAMPILPMQVDSLLCTFPYMVFVVFVLILMFVWNMPCLCLRIAMLVVPHL